MSVDGMDLSGDFDSQEYFNLIFLSTDIPNTGEITISDMKLEIDGRDVTIAPIVSPDSLSYINMLIQNIWNDDVKEIGYYQVPPTAMKITFTVSGFAYDNTSAAVNEPEATPEAPSEAAPAPTEAPADNTGSEGGMSPVVIVIIVVAVVAVIAVAAVVVTKKKKSGK